MCYIDDGCAQSVMQLGNFGTHLDTKFGVQVGQRLVHQENTGITDNRTTHGDTLSLAAGKSFRLTVKQVLQIQDLSCLFNGFFNLILRNLAELQTKCHVVKYGHMRIQGIVLENHGNISVLRVYVIHNLSVNFQRAGRNFLQTCNHTKRGRFSASGRTDENNEFLVSDFQIKIFNSLKAVGIFFSDVFQ